VLSLNATQINVQGQKNLLIKKNFGKTKKSLLLTKQEPGVAQMTVIHCLQLN